MLIELFSQRRLSKGCTYVHVFNQNLHSILPCGFNVTFVKGTTISLEKQ